MNLIARSAQSCILAILVVVVAPTPTVAQTASYPANIRQLIGQYCNECHQGDEPEADIDLAQFKTFGQLQRQPKVWQRVQAMLVSHQMPPQDALQIPENQRQMVTTWVGDFLRRSSQACW